MNKFPMPSKLDDMIVRNNMIRNTWPYKPLLDPELKRSPLDFSEHVVHYTNNVMSRRGAEQLDSIKSISDALRFQKETALICCIPCHVTENVDLYNISKLADLVTHVSGHVVILINGDSATSTPDLLEQAVQRLQRNLSRSAGGLTSVSIVPHIFDKKYPIGAIRGMLIDSVVVAAGRTGIPDPIVASMDIDIISVPENYTNIILDEFRSPVLDILSGPVFYGYNHLGENHTGQPIGLPELFLGNRAMYFRKLAVANGLKYGTPFYPTDGPNTVFRLAAYCAVGGHNYALESGEDSYIGAAIFGMRSTDGTLYPVAGHAIYRPNLWVATDPRRQLRAICSGHPIDATWREVPFDINLGSSMGTKELAIAYSEKSDFLQCQDITNARNDGFCVQQSHVAIAKIYKWAIENKNLPDEAIAFVRDGYGLDSAVPELPEEWPLAISDDLSEALSRCCGQRP